MTQKRIALVGYAVDYFWSFGRALEDAGFEVYWVTSVRSEARRLLIRYHVPSHRVLDTTAGFDPDAGSLDNCRSQVARLESADGPRVNDVILMDRMLRRKPPAFALKYLCHLQQVLTRFLSANDITLITSGRDTVLQVSAMLVGRALNIPWVVATRLRIPREMYGFCQGHETEPMVRIRAVTDADRVWAREFLEEFSNRRLRPVIQKAARSFGDVLRLFPAHVRLFSYALRASLADVGNDYSRYTVPALLRMYARRRVNLLRYKWSPPYSEPGDRPYLLYTLHTQPESSIDVAGSFFSDQVALITFIARSLPVTHDLYVKVHPADVDGKPLSFYRRIANIPGVRLINYQVDSRDLIDGSSLVLSLTGTSAYESALLGKHVVTFGRNFFNTLPTVHYCDAPPALPRLIRALLLTGPPADAQERILEFLADLKSRSFDGEVNRAYGEQTQNLSPLDLTRLQSAYDAIHRVLVPDAQPHQKARMRAGHIA